MSKHKPTHIRTHAFGSEEEFLQYVSASTSSSDSGSGYTTTEECDDEDKVPFSQERVLEPPSEFDEFDYSIVDLADHTTPLSETSDELLLAPQERALEPPSEFDEFDSSIVDLTDHTTPLSETSDELLLAPQERALEPALITFHTYTQTMTTEENHTHTTSLHETLGIPIVYCFGSMPALIL